VNTRQNQPVFITGATGYMGSRLIARLIDRGHQIRALARPESLHKLPKGCTAISGNALDENTFKDKVAPANAFVHLVGVANPNPGKAELFRKVDRVSAQAAVQAAVFAGVKHFVYVSVAHPAPMMKAYIEVRSECEKIIRDNGLNATIIRPWYVLGPGHWWPYALLPFYKIFENIPATAESANRLGLVKISQMIETLVNAVENPAAGIRIIEVPQIRQIAAQKTGAMVDS
jgi:uncharacterized protein YbjT (DUF2867 family)